MATIVTRAGKGSALTNAEVDANFTNLNTELGGKLAATLLGAVNGVASLDSSGLVPSTQLPAYVDDVLEYANLAALPGTGETGKIYVTLDTNKTYRWSGSTYVEISASPGSTDSVTEGSTNLYFTNARARGAISVTQNLTYNSTTGLITGPDLSGYLTSATAASTYQTQSGMSSYLTTSSASSTYLTQSNAASTYQTQSGMSSYLTTASASSTYLTQANAASTYQTQSGMSSYLTTATAASTYQPTLVSGTNIKSVNGSSLLGSGNLTVSGGISFTRRTANYTAVDKDGIIADTTGGAFTVTLPATPSAGTQVWIADGGNFSTNNLTVGRNGSTIEGLAEDMTLDITGALVQLIYDGTTWQVYAEVGYFGGTAVDSSSTQTLSNKTLASPTLTGTPVAPTAAVDTNTTQVATTAYVVGQGYLKSATASSTYLALAGGALTGGLREARVAMAASDISCTAGNYFTRTISATTTLTVSNVPSAGTAASFILDLTNGGSATINWWSGVKWASGTAPTLTSAGRDVLGFFTHDGGTTWTGLVLAKDCK